VQRETFVKRQNRFRVSAEEKKSGLGYSLETADISQNVTGNNVQINNLFRHDELFVTFSGCDKVHLARVQEEASLVGRVHHRGWDDRHGEEQHHRQVHGAERARVQQTRVADQGRDSPMFKNYS
jgi:hypothetical protein